MVADPGGEEDSDARRGPGHRRRWIVILVLLVALVAAGSAWTDHQANQYYVYQPGTAPHLTTSAGCRLVGSGALELADGSPCARLDVPAGRSHVLDGTLLMVDVLVGQSTPVQYVLHRLGLLGHFERGSQLIPNAEVRGTTPASQLACQDVQEMKGATSTAPVVALQRLGYHVGVDNLGAQITEVLPGTAATKAGIECNDLITAVDGRAVDSALALSQALRGRTPGSAVAITVRRTGTGGKSTTLTLHATLRAWPAADGQPPAPNAGFLGVTTEDDILYKLPFDISIQVGDIGGPSAGLALTLGLVEALSGDRLTGGHTVAATGTINPDGSVGDVGGVAQKTVAVERAGAQLFLVPPEEYKAAESEANGKMKIEAVTSLTQALAALKAFGGQIPAPAS